MSVGVWMCIVSMCFCIHVPVRCNARVVCVCVCACSRIFLDLLCVPGLLSVA